jgi:hypothetical protein
MKPPQAVIFDLDNTLADSFSPPAPSMCEKLGAVIARFPTAIMSAASLERIQRDVVANLPHGTDLSRLTLFTANAAQCFSWSGGFWQSRYLHGFTDEQREIVRDALDRSIAETGVTKDTEQYGDQYVYYEGYVAFTAVGVNAPRDVKIAWDPDCKKRNLLRAAVQEKLPQFDVYIGGATSVDVTPKGINKAYGVRAYAEQIVCTPPEMLFIGDALYEGGNDQIVISTGIETRAVSGPAETETVIDELLAGYAS